MARSQSVPTIRQVLAMFNGGRLRDAEEACRRIIKADRRHFDALHLLGVIAGKTNRLDEAMALFNRALKVRPEAAIIHCGIGRVLWMKADYDEALVHYERALKLKPRSPLALAGKAQTLVRRGDFDEARALLQPYVEAEREDAEMATVYATVLQQANEHESAVALIERHLSNPRTPNAPRRRMLFALGSSYGRLGDHDRAFEAYERANALDAQPFDIIGIRRSYDQLIRFFSPERLASLPRARNDSALPVFVVGMPRCGSTLVEQIIDAHPRAHGAGELTALGELVRSIPVERKLKTSYPNSLDGLDAATLDRFANRHLGRLRPLDRRADRIVDKQLENFKLLGAIELLFPNARVIHCRRDPMSVCFSIYTLDLMTVQLPYSTDLRNIGLYYREYERLMDHWRSVLGVRMLELRYEDLVAAQEEQSRAIIEFCGLEWDDACLRFHETGRDVATSSVDQVRRPMYTSALKRYEAYDRHLGPLKEVLGGG